MEKKDREKILDNISTFVNKTKNFEQIFKTLIDKKIFNEYMIKEIQSHNNKVEFFYLYVTTRGPNAFGELKEALTQTDNLELVQILANNSSCTVAIQGNGYSGPTLEEEYPFDQEWKMTITKERCDLNRERVYKMDSCPKGLLLIINTRTFVNETKEERLGSEHDVSRVESIFGQIGYKIVKPEKEDLTAEDIRMEVEKFSQMKEHEECDSSVVVVMSHGKSNALRRSSVDIYGWDSQTVNSDDIMDYFSAHRCPGLRQKPKLFFFQACRGSKYQYPVSLSETRTVAKKSPVLPTETDTSLPEGNLQTDGQRMASSELVINHADYFVGYSTAPEYVSHRDPETGSWYIQTLCMILARYAATEDLLSILTMTNSAMGKKTDRGSMQTSDSIHTFDKKLYFQPQVFDGD